MGSGVWTRAGHRRCLSIIDTGGVGHADMFACVAVVSADLPMLTRCNILRQVRVRVDSPNSSMAAARWNVGRHRHILRSR